MLTSNSALNYFWRFVQLHIPFTANLPISYLFWLTSNIRHILQVLQQQHPWHTPKTLFLFFEKINLGNAFLQIVVEHRWLLLSHDLALAGNLPRDRLFR